MKYYRIKFQGNSNSVFYWLGRRGNHFVRFAEKFKNMAVILSEECLETYKIKLILNNLPNYILEEVVINGDNRRNCFDLEKFDRIF